MQHALGSVREVSFYGFVFKVHRLVKYPRDLNLSPIDPGNNEVVTRWKGSTFSCKVFAGFAARESRVSGNLAQSRTDLKRVDGELVGAPCFESVLEDTLEIFVGAFGKNVVGQNLPRCVVL